MRLRDPTCGLPLDENNSIRARPQFLVSQDYAAQRSAGEHDLAGRSWLKNLLVRAHRIGERQFLANNGPQRTVRLNFPSCVGSGLPAWEPNEARGLWSGCTCRDIARRQLPVGKRRASFNVPVVVAMNECFVAIYRIERERAGRT
jgi:hypothetical protein